MTFPLVCSLFLSSFFLFFVLFFEHALFFYGPLSCRFVSITGVVLGISKLVEKVDDRLGKKGPENTVVVTIFTKECWACIPRFLRLWLVPRMAR